MYIKKDTTTINEIIKCIDLPAFKAYVDYNFGEYSCYSVNNKKSHMLMSGAFIYLTGMPDNYILKVCQSKLSSEKLERVTLIALNDLWEAYLKGIKLDFILHKFRYRSKLVQFKNTTNVKEIKAQYKFIKIDEYIFYELKRNEWSRTLCLLYKDYNKFRVLGSGYVACINNEIISCAISYFTYKKGIEVAIATKAIYQNKGLATYCASLLISDNLEKGFECNWDATSTHSLHIANTLGYHLKERYDAYYLYLDHHGLHKE